MFDYDITEEFEETLRKITKRNQILSIALHRKIKEIISRDKNTINSYKNLKYDLKEFKRVHVTSRIIMIFRVNLNENKILFVAIKHRDEAYKK
ncbi:MAG: type II toxin-antitoxin system RelE family toxin [Candidatus Nanoarchaeia archaeon]